MTRTLRPIVALVVVITSCVLLLVATCGSGLIRAAKAMTGGTEPDKPDPEIVDETEDLRLQFYNWLNDNEHRYNFGPNAFESVDGYSEPYGELLDRLTDDGSDDKKLPDPCLMSAVAYAMEDRLGVDILEETGNANQIVNDAAKHLIDDPDYRAEVLGKIKEVLETSETSIEEIADYTSTMWMVPNGFEDRPSITVEESCHNGGHALVIEKDGKVLKLRMECGYQPLEISWPTEPPKTTEPTTNPTTNPPAETTPTTETNPPTETTPPPTTLAPKDPQQAVPVQTDPDNGGSKGGDAIKDPTPEPSWTQTQATQPATQPATKAAQIEQPTVEFRGGTYVIDESGGMTPQKDVISNTPTDAAVAPDQVITGTAPAGGGSFADRYGW